MARERVKAAGDPRSRAFGDALKAARKERGLSQERAALECDLDRAYFGKLERGQKWPTLETIFKLGSGLDAKPSELLTRTERLLSKD